MKMLLSEFKTHVESAKTLVGEARKTVLAMLKGAEVTDEKGVAVDVELIEMADSAAPAVVAKTVDPAAPAVSADSITDQINKAVAAAVKGIHPAPITQPTIVKGKLPATVKRFGHLKNFKSRTGEERSPDERAGRFGMWAIATLGIQKFADMSAYAKSWCEDAGILVKYSAENTNTNGGALVPDEFSEDLIDLREQYGVFRKYANIKKMNSDTLTVPRRIAGLTAYAVGEGAKGTESTKTWDQVKLVAKDAMVLTRYTNQLSMDAVINIGDDLAGEIAYAFANYEDNCGFIGTGVSAYSGITGVTQRLLNVWTTAGGQGLVVSTGTGYATNWNSVVLGDFERVIGALPQYADTPNAAWYCHKTFFGSVIQRLITAAGGNTVPLIQDGARKLVFLGYPVVISQVLPKTSAVSQVACFFGDLSLAATFGDRQQDAIAMSEHATVNGTSVFETNELAVRGTERFDINVHDVGDGATNAGPIVGLLTASS